MLMQLMCPPGGGGNSAGPRILSPPQGASDQQLVVKGTSPRSRWVPKAPNCTQAGEALP